jgi:hypothetical protein
VATGAARATARTVADARLRSISPLAIDRLAGERPGVGAVGVAEVAGLLHVDRDRDDVADDLEHGVERGDEGGQRGGQAGFERIEVEHVTDEVAHDGQQGADDHVGDGGQQIADGEAGDVGARERDRRRGRPRETEQSAHRAVDRDHQVADVEAERRDPRRDVDVEFRRVQGVFEHVPDRRGELDGEDVTERRRDDRVGCSIR